MRYLIALLAVVGIVVSVLALRVHYNSGPEPCSINDKWDCGIVNHSPYAMIGPVPVATLGIAGYLVLAGLALARQRFPLLVVVLGGLGFALRLTFLEEYVIDTWCLYCVASQFVIGLMTLLSLGWLAADYYSMKRASAKA